MYKEFKLVQSDYIYNHIEIYSNNLLFVFVDYIKDTVKIAKRTTFDRWSNSGVVIGKVPYTNLEYDVFEHLLIAEIIKASNGLIATHNYPHKKLTFV